MRTKRKSCSSITIMCRRYTVKNYFIIMRHIFCVFLFQSAALDDEEKSWELKHIITIKISIGQFLVTYYFFRNWSFSRLKVCIRALHFQIKVCPVCCWCHIDQEKWDTSLLFRKFLLYL